MKQHFSDPGTRSQTSGMIRSLIKWPGGKRALAPQILNRLPDRIPLYREPFLGGGAIFWALLSEGRIQKAILSDLNPDLINLYRTTITDPEAILDVASSWATDEATYYQIRARDDPSDPIGRAARTLYLSRTCFNGLYRTNKSGQFNAPWGHKTGPITFPDLVGAAQVLRSVDVTFQVASFRDQPFDGVVYCDPPYVDTFTGYTAEGFSYTDLRELADICREADRAVVSHTGTVEALEIFEEWGSDIVTVGSRIGPKAKNKTREERIFYR